MDLIELSNHDLQLATRLKALIERAKDVGASKGAQRLGLIGQHFKKLTVEEAYHFIDPEAILNEVEESHANRKTGLGTFLFTLRNIFSLLPLLLTWSAMSYAVYEYQQDLSNPKYLKAPFNDQYQPFLRLWQDGFHGKDFFTFSVTGIGDVLLISFFLLCIVLIPFIENRTWISFKRSIESFSNDLKEITDQLLQVVGSVGISPITTEADIDKIVKAIKRAVEQTLLTSDQVAKAAQQAIDNSNKKMEDMFKNQIQVMIDQFRTDLGTFHADLKQLGSNLLTYSTQVKDLTTASTSLAGASGTLASNASQLATSAHQYAQVGQDISTQIGSLSRTQQQVVTEFGTTQQQVVTEIKGVAGSMNIAAQATNQAASNLGNIAKQDIVNMTTQVIKAADSVTDTADALIQLKASLLQVDQLLQQTVQSMQFAAQTFATVAANSAGSPLKPPPKSLIKKIFRRP